MQMRNPLRIVYRFTSHIENPMNSDNEKAKERYEKIKQWNKLKSESTMSDEEIANFIGVSRASIYRWKREFRAQGLKGLEPQSTRPHKLRESKITQELKDDVLKVRRENPVYGKGKLRTILERDYGTYASESMVGRILEILIKKGKITRVHYIKKPTRPRIFNKHAQPYQYGMRPKKPGEFVQIDHMTVTDHFGKTRKHFQGIDQVTKYLDAQVYSNATALSAKKFLIQLIDNFPFKVISIQVDGGSEFMKEFEEACKELGIALYILPPRRPQWNGCVERSNGTLRREFYELYEHARSIEDTREMLEEFVVKYNTYRPHQSLKYKTPMEYFVDFFLELKRSFW